VRDGGSPTSAVHGLPQARFFVRLGGSLATYAWNTPQPDPATPPATRQPGLKV
jgi:hypothetical protein